MLMSAIVLHFRTPPRNVTVLVRQALAFINSNLTVVNLRAFSFQVSGNLHQDCLLSRLCMRPSNGAQFIARLAAFTSSVPALQSE